MAAPGLDGAALLTAMTRDKKNQGGRIRFVLPDRLGSVSETEAPADLLRAVVAATLGDV